MEDRIAENFAYAMMQQLQARIEMEGMKAANLERTMAGDSPAYGQEDFVALIEKHHIHHNGLLTLMQEGR